MFITRRGNNCAAMQREANVGASCLFLSRRKSQARELHPLELDRKWKGPGSRNGRWLFKDNLVQVDRWRNQMASSYTLLYSDRYHFYRKGQQEDIVPCCTIESNWIGHLINLIFCSIVVRVTLYKTQSDQEGSFYGQFIDGVAITTSITVTVTVTVRPWNITIINIHK